MGLNRMKRSLILALTLSGVIPGCAGSQFAQHSTVPVAKEQLATSNPGKPERSLLGRARDSARDTAEAVLWAPVFVAFLPVFFLIAWSERDGGSVE